MRVQYIFGFPPHACGCLLPACCNAKWLSERSGCLYDLIYNLFPRWFELNIWWNHLLVPKVALHTDFYIAWMGVFSQITMVTPGLLCFKEKQVSSMLDLLVSRLTVCSCFAQLFKCRQKQKLFLIFKCYAVVGDDSILFWTDRWFNGGTPAELAPNSKLYQKGWESRQ